MLQCRQRTGHLSSFWVPTPRNLPSKVKKIANVRWSAQGGGGGGGGRVDAAGIDCHGITATNCQGRYIICVGRQWFHPVVSSPPAGLPHNKSSKISSSTLLITLVKS